MAVAWRDEYLFGDAEIDDQHREFFALSEQLTAEARHGVGDLVQALADLLTHASFHFSCEESLMASVGYPDLVRHRASHRAFADTMMEMAERLHGPNAVAPREIARFVEAWIAGHIIGEDMAVKAYLDGQGRQLRAHRR